MQWILEGVIRRGKLLGTLPIELETSNNNNVEACTAR